MTTMIIMVVDNDGSNNGDSVDNKNNDKKYNK